MSFPILSCTPTKIDVEYLSSTIKSEFEKGYVQTRERHTRDRKRFSVSYTVDKVDKALIIEHFNIVRGSVIFSWTDPDTSSIHQVRYSVTPKYTVSGANPVLQDLTFELEEV